MKANKRTKLNFENLRDIEDKIEKELTLLPFQIDEILLKLKNKNKKDKNDNDNDKNDDDGRKYNLFNIIDDDNDHDGMKIPIQRFGLKY